MDLVAEVLFAELQRAHASEFDVTMVRPIFRRGFSAIPGLRESHFPFNADRMFNRYVLYPQKLALVRDEFDLFHVIDHSYAHLVHELPGERTLVTCHDVDIFDGTPGGRMWGSAAIRSRLARRIVAGLRRCAKIACVSTATRDRMAQSGVAPIEKLCVIPNGVETVFSPHVDAGADAEVARLLGPQDTAIELLHVGSTIPRKRIEDLLRIFAAIRMAAPETRLVQVGGRLNSSQSDLAARLGIGGGIVSLPFLNKAILASVYRRAALLLMPSDSEGFGLPIVEAMACGTPAVCSDIPALHEVAAEAAEYCAVGHVDQWVSTLSSLLRELKESSAQWERRRMLALQNATRFSWVKYAFAVTALYRSLLS